MVVHHRISETGHSVQKDYTKLLGASWARSLRTKVLSSKYMSHMQCYIEELYKATDFVFPRNKEDIFKAFDLTNANDIKVVIFGNEPNTSIHSNGLAFGSFKGARGIHMLKQTRDIQHCLFPDEPFTSEKFDPTLRSWANQEVLMLNISLVSEYGKPLEHELIFRNFIREVVVEINNAGSEIVFVFTDKRQSDIFSQYIDLTYHSILHYDGIKHDSSIFEDINRVLEEQRGTPNMIEW